MAANCPFSHFTSFSSAYDSWALVATDRWKCNSFEPLYMFEGCWTSQQMGLKSDYHGVHFVYEGSDQSARRYCSNGIGQHYHAFSAPTGWKPLRRCLQPASTTLLRSTGILTLVKASILLSWVHTTSQLALNSNCICICKKKWLKVFERKRRDNEIHVCYLLILCEVPIKFLRGIISATDSDPSRSAKRQMSQNGRSGSFILEL